MAGHASRVERDIDRWLAAGLIDAATAERLRRDLAAHARRSVSFGAIVMIMAAVLVCAAILLVIASNWEAIPRLVKVGLIFALILGGYVGGALMRLRGHAAAGDALWLVAAASFGGGIALIGQMYHLAGDERTALLVWCGGTGLAALALRSAILTVATAAIALAWLAAEGFGSWTRADDLHLYLAMAVLLWALSFWTGSRATRHLVALSLLLYATLLAASRDETAVGAALAAISALLFAVAALRPAIADALRLEGRLDVHALAGFLLGMGLVQADGADDWKLLALSAVLVFGGVIAALILAGRDSRAVRWLAYAGFLAEIAFLYLNTLGTMLGSVGLFLASGVALALVAFVVIRVERRLIIAEGAL